MMFDVRVDDFRVGLTEPIHTARGAIFERVGQVLVVHDDAGNWGRGELAPLPGWSSIDVDEAVAELDVCSRRIRSEGFSIDMTPFAPEVRAAVDASRLSLEAARIERPLWEYLGGSRGSVDVNALVVGADVQDLVDHAREAIGKGYRTLKVKLGMGDDAERLSSLAAEAASANAEGVRIRLDANAGWSVAEAAEWLEVAGNLLGEALEYVEDPVDGLDALADLRQLSSVPVAVDEGVRSLGDLHAVLESRLADVLVVKPPLVGGISATRALADVAAAHGVDVVVSSLFDGPVGLAAWCHLAAALGGERAHGLGTATLLADAGAAHLVPRGGKVTL